MPNTNDIADLDDRVTGNTADIAGLDTRVDANTAGIAGLDTRVTTNTSDIAALQAGLGNVPVGYVSDADPSIRSTTPTDTAGFIGASGGAVTVTNVAAGAVATGSTDAVNGDQLAATNAAVAASTATGAANTAAIGTNTTAIAGLDTRVTENTADIAGLDTRVTNNTSTIASNTTAIAGLDTRVTTNTSAIADNSEAIAALETGAVQYDDASQGTVTLGGAAGTRVTNVAAGAVAAASTDAVNGSQLAATNTRVSTIENNLAGSTVVAVQYSDPANPNVSNGGTITNDVVLVGADASAPVALHNVAAGRTATDAVNLGQLQSQLTSALTTAQSYTDTRVAAAMELMSTQVANVQFDLGELRRDAMSGVAGAMAFAGIPQTMEVGKSMLGGAIAHYRGQTAFAFGFSSALGDGKAAIKVGGSVDARGHVGVTAGGGIAF